MTLMHACKKVSAAQQQTGGHSSVFLAQGSFVHMLHSAATCNLLLMFYSLFNRRQLLQVEVGGVFGSLHAHVAGVY
eukprot:CAMPEP_0202896356 /NCGR_PEP_ID=MMETSP1392-20130828/5378_1 /ASSEMBLY_ACC=CAM_ASM_000868 /TAXON_ID=225041 /ORGANISM="Chlamydomonas chlamydogama, Strain SAG 11-48b" /LENGTH=75 /DNA_ID=CAMNT_0049581687 /DNA_START=419 /DNA_END=643 /DNA_ORIENTATION=+